MIAQRIRHRAAVAALAVTLGLWLPSVCAAQDGKKPAP